MYLHLLKIFTNEYILFFKKKANMFYNNKLYNYITINIHVI